MIKSNNLYQDCACFVPAEAPTASIVKVAGNEPLRGDSGHEKYKSMEEKAVCFCTAGNPD